MQQSAVLVEVPFLQLGILFHVSQCMHFFFSSQVQRHVEVVRPALAISITTDGGSQNGDEGFTAVSITWPGFHGRTLETEALPSHHQ